MHRRTLTYPHTLRMRRRPAWLTTMLVAMSVPGVALASDIAVTPDDGSLADLSQSLSAGAIVRVRAPGSVPTASAATATIARDQNVVVVEQVPGRLSDSLDTPPPGTVYKLRLVAGDRAASAARSSLPAVDRLAPLATRSVVLPAGAPQPAFALAAPGNGITKLSLAGRLTGKGAAQERLPGEVSSPVQHLDLSYAGGPLPNAAVSPPPGTLVRLVYAPGANKEVAQATDEGAAATEELVLSDGGGPLPAVALDPPAGVVVKLLSPARR